MRQLAPTLHNEGVLIKEMDGRLNSFADVGAEMREHSCGRSVKAAPSIDQMVLVQRRSDVDMLSRFVPRISTRISANG